MATSMHTAVLGPAWADQSVNRIRGLFPLSVEQYLNQAVAAFVPSVTTVTNVARNYALHGLVMAEARSRDLGTEDTRRLLRKAEVVMSLASIAHEEHADHPRWMPDAHARDKLRAAWADGSIDIDLMAGAGDDAYAGDPWGFMPPYIGSELRLGILGSPWTLPGPGFDESLVSSSLGGVFQLVEEWGQVSESMAKAAGHLCICAVTNSQDGDWLARRLAGDASKPHTVASTLANTMTLVAKVIETGGLSSTEGESQLADVIRYGTILTDDPTLSGMPVAHRWRGICLRQAAVHAWREIWFFLSVKAHEGGGFLPIAELQDWLGALAPNQTLGVFMDRLPRTMDGPQTLAAEKQLDDFPPALQALARILMSGERAKELEGDQLWGYLADPSSRDRKQELSPLWVADVIERWRHRSMGDFCSYLVKVLLDRSQRVALDKAGYRNGQYVLPARVLLRDGFVEWRDREGAAPPPLRLERILHIGRQVGLFETDEEGFWKLGRRGGYVAE